MSSVNSFVNLYEPGKSWWQAITGETFLFIDHAAGLPFLIDASRRPGQTAVHPS